MSASKYAAWTACVLLLAGHLAAGAPTLRHLLQDEETPTADPIFKTGTNFVATETPSFKVKSNPTPAGYTTNTNVRSERPYLTVKNTVPASVVTASADTKVQTWDSATYKFTQDVNGIKSAFDTGKRVFEVNTGNQAAVNFPTYEVAGGGGTPFKLDTATEITGSTPNTAINIASGAGPSGSGGWALALGPANLGRKK